MAEVFYTSRARLDILAIVEHFAEHSPAYAVVFLGRIDRAVGQLQVFPMSGHVVAAFERRGLRELPVDAFRLFYYLDHDDVVILRVRNARMSLRRALGPNPLDYR